MDSFFAHVQVAVSRNGTLIFIPGGDRALAGSANDGWPHWSRRGDRLAFTRSEESVRKIMVQDIQGERAALQIHQGTHAWPSLSPDGRWLIHSDVAGSGVWVRSLPGGELVERLTGVNGGELRWCGGCGEIFFADAKGWNAMAVTTQPELRLGPPRLVFQTEFLDTPGLSYDVSSDGQRLYVLKTVAPQIRDRIHVVANLGAELERMAGR